MLTVLVINIVTNICLNEIFFHLEPLKDQCAGFRRIYQQKLNLIFIMMFS